MRKFLLSLSVLGVLLFGGAFAISLLDPLLIERAAREIVRIEVEHRVGETIDNLSDKRIVELAQRALGQANAEFELTRRAIRNEVPRRVANTVADMLNADCECRKRLVEYAQQAELSRLSSLGELRQKLSALIESAYASVTRNLMREFRIFTASNAIAFALLGVITFVRRGAALQLVLPAVVLLGAAGVTGSLYLFNQNWLHTIVFGNYVGLAYAGYLSGVALLFADIVFNRARVTTQIVNAVLQVVGSALTAVPC